MNWYDTLRKFTTADIKERVARNNPKRERGYKTAKAESHKRKILARLLAGGTLTNSDAACMLQSEAGGRRLRDVVEMLEQRAIKVCRIRATDNVVLKYIEPSHLQRARGLFMDLEV